MNKDVEEILSRGVSTLIDPEGIFKDKLGKKARGEYDKNLVIKFGVDPTRPDIHIGHAVIFRKLRQFQDLGCKVIFLVGDYTAQIGDPTGASKIRPEITFAEVQKNMQTYLDQVGKILIDNDPELFSWITNSEWFMEVTDIAAGPEAKVVINDREVDPNSFIGKAAIFESTRMQKKMAPNKQILGITIRGLLWTLKHITHSRLIDRDMFQERLKRGEELYMHEMLYPVLQGIDSFALHNIYGSCDLEIGGSDQTFNMLMGRDVMKANGLPQQAVMSMEILPGLDGKEKMSKSLDNYIAITDSPSEMFGKTMSLPDECIGKYFKLATYTPLDEVEELEKKLESGKTNPKELKARLAREIVSIYHGEKAAKEAHDDFEDTFSKGGVPADVEVVKYAVGSKLSEIVLGRGLIESKTEWRRLVEDGAIKDMETGERISSADALLDKPVTLKVGKHRFLKIDVL